MVRDDLRREKELSRFYSRTFHTSCPVVPTSHVTPGWSSAVYMLLFYLVETSHTRAINMQLSDAPNILRIFVRSFVTFANSCGPGGTDVNHSFIGTARRSRSACYKAEAKYRYSRS